VLKPGAHFVFVDKTSDNPLANFCYRIFRFLPRTLRKGIEDDDLSIDGRPIPIRFFRHREMLLACELSRLETVHEERYKILSWFFYYLEKFLPFRTVPFMEKIEIILRKTPAKSLCFVNLLEVVKK